MNFDSSYDMFTIATKMALEDDGVDMLRYLCWAMAGVKVDPRYQLVARSGLSISDEKRIYHKVRIT